MESKAASDDAGEKAVQRLDESERKGEQPARRVSYLLPLMTAISLSLGAACSRSAVNQTLRQALAQEIVSLGGDTNKLPAVELTGAISIKRDAMGAVIDSAGLRFEEAKLFFASAYGEPRFYTKATDEHGPIYVFPPKQAGISIFITSTRRGCEITLLRPIKTPP
jgi:hypothetical protein